MSSEIIYHKSTIYNGAFVRFCVEQQFNLWTPSLLWFWVVVCVGINFMCICCHGEEGTDYAALCWLSSLEFGHSEPVEPLSWPWFTCLLPTRQWHRPGPPWTLPSPASGLCPLPPLPHPLYLWVAQVQDPRLLVLHQWTDPLLLPTRLCLPLLLGLQGWQYQLPLSHRVLLRMQPHPRMVLRISWQNK